jgi:hypothetical protein
VENLAWRTDCCAQPRRFAVHLDAPARRAHRRRIAVIAGAASPRKIVLLSGAPAVLQAQVAEWFDALPIL